jgi:aspartate/glutamate racemase
LQVRFLHGAFLPSSPFFGLELDAVSLSVKTLGIVGGIGPESTIEYYRFILDGYRFRVNDGTVPHIIIDSIDVNRGIAMLDANDLASLTDYLSGSRRR